MASRVYISESGVDSPGEYIDYAHGVDLYDLGLRGDKRKWTLLLVAVVIAVVVVVGVLAFNYEDGNSPSANSETTSLSSDKLLADAEAAMRAWANYSSSGDAALLDGYLVADSPAHITLKSALSQTGSAKFEFRNLKLNTSAVPDSVFSVTRNLTAESVVNGKDNGEVKLQATFHLINGQWRLFEFVGL